MKTLKKFLEENGANTHRYESVYRFTKDLTLDQFLNTCHRGDWILWLFAKMNPESLRELTLAKGHCANTVRKPMKDKRSLAAVDAAIAFGEGEIDAKELKIAYDAAVAAASAYDDAAYAAVYASCTGVASQAIYVAVYTASASASADAAYIAAAANIKAADSASAASDADYAVHYAHMMAKRASRLETANICRKYLPLAFWDQSKL